jgi:hypothetical protein
VFRGMLIFLKEGYYEKEGWKFLFWQNKYLSSPPTENNQKKLNKIFPQR